MALLSEQDRQAVQGHLAGLQHQVTLLFFTQTIGGPETALIAKQILTELAGLSGKIALEEVNFVLDRDRAATYAVDKIPAVVVLRNGEDTRIRFFGAPAGYEFMSLVEAIILAGGDDSGLTEESKTLIAGVKDPVDLQVFVTPT
jgi:alkyl hydroperoxide reductase subunit AhpF